MPEEILEKTQQTPVVEKAPEAEKKELPFKELASILRSERKTEYIKDYYNLLDLVKRKMLTIGQSKVRMEEEHLENLRCLIGQTIEVFGENWDIQVKPQSDDTVNIVGIDILFPKVTIKNSKRKTHEIEDLYIKLVLAAGSSNRIRVINIEGARGKLSVKEYSCSYLHSHLPRNHQGTAPEGLSFQRFCTGGGAINDTIGRFDNDNSADNASDLLLRLMTLVSWESLEGVPHTRMEDIRYMSGGSSRQSGLRNLPTDAAVAESFGKTVLKAIEIGELPIQGIRASITNNQISIDVEDVFLANIISRENFKRFVGVAWESSVVTKESLIEHIKNLNANTPHGVSIPKIEKKTGYFFNGKEVHLQFTDYDPDVVEKKEKVELEIIYKIPERYVNTFKQQCAEEIYKQQVRRVIAERYA